MALCLLQHTLQNAVFLHGSYKLCPFLSTLHRLRTECEIQKNLWRSIPGYQLAGCDQTSAAFI